MIKLTYLIPVYNEFKTVAKSINQILNLKLKDTAFQLRSELFTF